MPENQVQVLEQFCVAYGWAIDEWIKEIGVGLNSRHRHFLRIFDAIVHGRIERLVVAQRDLLCRFGFEMIQYLCRLHACTPVTWWS